MFVHHHILVILHIACTTQDGDDGAQGELLEKPAAESVEIAVENAGEKEVINAPTFKNRLSSIKIPNPFAKKPKDVTPVADDADKDVAKDPGITTLTS